MADKRPAEGNSGVLVAGCALLAVVATVALLGAILGEPLASILTRLGIEMPPADRDRLAARQDGDPMRVAVPLLCLPKGTLLDGMVITHSSGESLMKLARRDTIALIGLAVRSLFSAAYLGDAPGDARTEAALEGIQRLVEEEIAETFQELVTGLEPVSFGPFGVLSALVRQSATEYVLAVEAPLQSGCALSIGYTGSVSIRTYHPGPSGSVGGLIGLEPSEIEIPLRAARLFDNYHAELDGRNREMAPWSGSRSPSPSSPSRSPSPRRS